MGKYVMTVMRGGEKCRLVRVPGQPSKLFRLKDYASEKDADEAAEAYAAMLVESPVKLPMQRSPKANSESGVPGVRVKMIQGRRYWIAEWNPAPNKSKRAVFSVNEHGEEQAKAMAIAHREKHATKGKS